MNRNIKKSTVVLIIGILAAFSVFPAFAAAPSNDDFDDANVISELPFSDAVDTTGATTADDDPDCFGQGPTVWYEFTPEEDVNVRADTVGSDYDTTLSVYTGSRGDLTQIACNDGAVDLQSRVQFEAVAGETYFFMVGAFGGGPGGQLVFSADTYNGKEEQKGKEDPTSALRTVKGKVRVQGFTRGETGSKYRFNSLNATYRISSTVDDQRITVGLIARPDVEQPYWYVNSSAEGVPADIHCSEGSKVWEESVYDEGQGAGCLGVMDLAFNTSYTVVIIPSDENRWSVWINGVKVAELIGEQADHSQDEFLGSFQIFDADDCLVLTESPPTTIEAGCKPPTPGTTEGSSPLAFNAPIQVDDTLFEMPLSYADQRQASIDSQLDSQLVFNAPVEVDDTLFERPMSYADQRQAVIDSRGRIYITAVVPRNAGDGFGTRRQCVIWRSLDQGRTWSQFAIVSANTGNIPARSGSLAVDSQDRLHVVFYDSAAPDAIWYRRFHPGTNTWSPSLSQAPRIIARPALDHPTLVVHPNNDNFLLVAWDGLRYSTSSNGGFAWSSVRSFGSGGATARAVPLILSNGNWLISTGHQQRISRNQGASWTSVATPDSGADFRGYASNCRRSNNTIHVVYEADIGRGVTEIRYVTSGPFGAGWSSPISISRRAGWWQSFPGITVDENDTLHVTWFESNTYDPGTPYSNSPAGIWNGKEIKVMSKPLGEPWQNLRTIGPGSTNVWPNFSYNNQLPGDNRIVLTFGRHPPSDSEAVVVFGNVQ